MRYDDILFDLRLFYDRDAALRDRAPKVAWKLEERQQFLNYLLREKKHRFLEVGAGTGQDSHFFQQRGLEVICTDLSPTMVKRCQQKGLTAYAMDFLHLDFPPASFEAIYAINCLLHVPKAAIAGVLNNIRSLLIPDGLFYLGMYGGEDKEGIFHYGRQQEGRFYSYHSTERLTELAQKYFEIVYFKSIDVGVTDRACFQSFILRKQKEA